MNILMITEKDAANVSLAKIAEAFLRKGHSIEIYAPYYEERVLRYFPKDIIKNPYEKLTQEAVNSFDVVFASSVTGGFVEQKGILLAKKPIFTQNYLIDKQITWGGDYCFVPSLETTETEYDPYLAFKKLAVGEPKYDKPAEKISEKKQFLFIDSGHFPFGKRGKQELARTLLTICDHFPEYQLVIKPRFLPGDQIRTHQNKLDLYRMLQQESRGCLPANLHVLSEHRDLQTLIEESHVVICMYTTAFAGAVLADKGLVILDYLPNEDAYDLREKVLNRVREQMKGSQALVDYRDAVQYLPHGIKAGSPYRRFLFAEESDSAERICRETERLAEKQVDWNPRILQRYRDYLMYKTFIHIDFHAKAQINIEDAYEEIEEFTNTYVRKRIENTQTDFHETIADFSLSLRNKTILKNKEQFKRDPIDIGIYLNALYLTKKYEEIMRFPEYDLGAVSFFKGITDFQSGRRQAAKDRLLKFADQAIRREYIKEISDMLNNKRLGMETLIHLLEESGEKEQADFYRRSWQQ